MRVTDGGDGASNDHADWANASIIMKDGVAKPLALAPGEKFSIQAQTFALEFPEVGDDGRLYQTRGWYGGHKIASCCGRMKRNPQAGDGCYIWELALQVVHAYVMQ